MADLGPRGAIRDDDNDDDDDHDPSSDEESSDNDDPSSDEESSDDNNDDDDPSSDEESSDDDDPSPDEESRRPFHHPFGRFRVYPRKSLHYLPLDPTAALVDGFRCAAECLEYANSNRGRRHPLVTLDVKYGPERRGGFLRFVPLLNASRTIRSLELYDESLKDLPEDAMERLFNDVLPNHPTLEYISISVAGLPIRFLRMLTESFPSSTEEKDEKLSSSTSLTGLGIRVETRTVGRVFDPTLQAQAVQAVVDMLSRGAAITNLDLALRLTSDQCQRICQAASRNAYLARLELTEVDDVRAESLVGLAASSSSLRHLDVTASSFSADVVPSLARQLRTNESITSLHFDPLEEADVQALLGLVSTYNVTLEDIDEWPIPEIGPEHDQLQAYLKRNKMIRNLLQQLETSSHPGSESNSAKASSPHVIRLSRKRLPILLDRVSDVPTALFRILKMGYGVEVSACIMAKFNSNGPCTGLRRSLRVRRRRGEDDD